MKRFRQLCKSALFKVCGVVHHLGNQSGNAILLTFDDGPDPTVTPEVLARLEKYRERGVFFIIGNRVGSAGWVLKAMPDQGHVIGNHGYQHPLGRQPWLLPYLRDIIQCQTMIGSLVGRTPTLFRPPLGWLSFASLLAPRLIGMKTVMWTADAGDWKVRSDKEAVTCAEQLSRMIGPGDIVLLHDFNPFLLPLLDTLLPNLAARGFDLAKGVTLLESR